MAYQAHTLVTFGGTLAEKSAGDEIWQCGIRGFNTGGGPVPQANLAALALAVLRGPTGAGGGLEGIWGGANGLIANTAMLKWCKAVNINPDGSYAAEPGIAQGINVAGAAGPTAPSFCSVAVSWTTGSSFGLARSGRIYLPNYAARILLGSTVNASDITSIGTFAQNLLKAVDHSSSADGYDFNPYVVSRSGVSRPIAGIRVGNVYDSQRRRKNAVAESYSTFALIGPSGA